MTQNHSSSTNDECAMSVEEARLLAHELRAPMTAIVGYSGMLRRSETAEEREQIIEGLERAVGRMDAMLQAAVTGSLTTNPVPGITDTVDLCALAREAVTDLRVSSAVEISVRCDAEAVVPGDSLLLRRALDNLLANAVSYGNGTPIDVDAAIDGTVAVVSVSDRGPGIPQVDRERVLLPTVRLARDADTPGTGLGLSVVANVAEAHGGRIRILGREGGGTTVAVELPAARV